MAAFLYVAARAWLLEITFDEDWSVHGFATKSFGEIILCRPCDANNHLLNTLLIRFFKLLFSDSLFVARLPNVLAFLVYWAAAHKISAKLLPLPRICLFLLLISNPFVLDFFSLARGYGLSIAFVTASSYFALRHHRNTKLGSAVLAISMASLAVLSNFTTLYFFVAVSLVVGVTQLIRLRKNLWEYLSIELAVASALGLIILGPILELSSNKLLFYGGREGFYRDTLYSLASYTHGHPFEAMDVAIYLKAFLLLSGAIFVAGLWSFRQKWQGLWSSPALPASALLAIPALISILAVWLMDNLYLINRTALFLYPLAVITLGYWADTTRRTKARWVSFTALGIISLMLLVNLLHNLNLHKSITWPHDTRTQKILQKINTETTGKERVVLDSSWPFIRSIEYYIRKGGYDNFHYHKKNRYGVEEGQVDYFIYFDRPLWKLGYFAHEHPILGYSKDTLMHFPEEGIWVFSNLKAPKADSIRTTP